MIFFAIDYLEDSWIIRKVYLLFESLGLSIHRTIEQRESKLKTLSANREAD